MQLNPYTVMLRLMSLAVISTLALLIASFAPQNKPAPKTIQIGNQLWLAENVNVPYAGSWCYNNDPLNCKKYGRLYNYELATLACSRIGEGWRLPTNADWETMVATLGSVKLAALKLKPGGDIGFNAVYGGFKVENTEEFKAEGSETAYWTSSPMNPKQVFIREIKSFSPMVIEGYAAVDRGLSCRCVKDLPKGE